MAIPANTCVQQCRLQGGYSVLVTYGVTDDLKCVPPSTYCGAPWSGCAAQVAAGDDLWPTEVPEDKRSLWFARIFITSGKGEGCGTPISIAECVASGDVSAELEWRRQLGFQMDIDRIRLSLSHSGVGTNT